MTNPYFTGSPDERAETAPAPAFVIVYDGQTQWCARQDELVAAMDRLGWANTRERGCPARREPDGEDATEAYTALCQIVSEQPMPGNPADYERLEWAEDVRAWVWC